MCTISPVAVFALGGALGQSVTSIGNDQPDAVEAALLEPIGNIPPAEAETNYYATVEEPRMAA
jgi:hypothetical protein